MGPTMANCLPQSQASSPSEVPRKHLSVSVASIPPKRQALPLHQSPVSGGLDPAQLYWHKYSWMLTMSSSVHSALVIDESEHLQMPWAVAAVSTEHHLLEVSQNQPGCRWCPAIPPKLARFLSCVLGDFQVQVVLVRQPRWPGLLHTKAIHALEQRGLVDE